MAIRDRIAQALWPAGTRELDDLRERVRVLSLAQQVLNTTWEAVPSTLARPEVGQRLSELGGDAYRWYLSNSNWESIGSLGGTAVTDSDRRTALELSRMGYQTLILYKRMVAMWIDFALGARPTITIDDEQAQEDFNRFWQADENMPVLSQSRLPFLFEKQLVDGEIFPAFFINTATGLPTIRNVATDQITTILYPEGDDATELGYVRQSINGQGGQVTRYYRDWAVKESAFAKALDLSRQSGGILAAKENSGTDVVMQHVWFDGDSGRGWPAFYRSVWWARRYEDFMTWRLTLARAVATFMEDVTTKGGSRDVRSVISALQSSYALGADSETNPAAPVGSPFVHNEAVSRSRMPLSTGAGDAQIDGMTVLSYVGLAAGIPPHWLGRPDMMQNRATARELLLPTMRQWERYQSMWEDVFRTWVRIVLQAAQTYPAGQDERYDKPIAEMTIDVNMATALSSAEFADIVSAIGTLQQANVLRPQELTKIALGLPELDIEDPDEIYAEMYPETTEQGGPGEDTPGTGTAAATPAEPEDEDKLAGQEDEEPEDAAMSQAAERALVEAAIRRILEDGTSD